MDRFLETAGLASVGGWFRRRGKAMHVEVGTPCPNCGAPLQGPYCYSCGQSGEDLHRSVWKLIAESLEGFFHADGRLWKTAPRLLFKPGPLTRDYLDGKRAPQIPPFRMFLVLLLIVFFAGHLATSQQKAHEDAKPKARPTATLDEIKGQREGIAEGEKELRENVGAAAGDAYHKRMKPLDDRLAAQEKQLASGHVSTRLPIDAKPGVPVPPKPGEPAKPGAQVMEENIGGLKELDIGDDFRVNIDGDEKHVSPAEHWLETRIKAIRANPDRFALVLEIWAHRVAILALPVSAFLLTMLFVFNRRFFVFDHLVFSMHSLSFQLILLTAIFLLSMLVGPAAWWLVLLSPIHLYKHMRGTYQTSWFGTVLRMAFLWVGTLIGFSLLAALWIVLGANDMAPH